MTFLPAFRRATVIAVLLSVITSIRPAGADVLVFAAASTTGAIGEIASLYQDRAGEDVRTAFAATSALTRQIEAGAPADVFVSANVAWMDHLAGEDGIEPGSRRSLLGNRLVLIAPRDRTLDVEIGPGFPLAASLNGGRLAIADPDHVPAGIYARAALESLGVWASVADRTAPAAHVRGALALVERGEATAGIVYATDAAISSRVRIAGVFPPESHPTIVYEAAIVAGRSRTEVTRFFEFIGSEAAAQVFARHGFSPLH